MSKILITGFDAFGGESTNPASKVLQHLERSGSRVGRGIEVITREIPTVFGSSAQAVREVVEAIRQERIPAALSYSAGTFVCNHVFYSTCHFVASRSLNIKVGFIHVPYLPEQAVEKDASPSMSRECVVAALEAAVRAVAKTF